jgi:enoyl-CoA hydratase/carnithine racemase
MDLSVFSSFASVIGEQTCDGRRRESVIHFIEYLQNVISMPEKCRVPVIAQVSGSCIGGAVDLISACDMVYCTENSSFSIKEIDLAIVADIGTLQRLPKLIGLQKCKELAYTGRYFSGKDAKVMGLALECFQSDIEMTQYVQSIALEIDSKSPLTVRSVIYLHHFLFDN